MTAFELFPMVRVDPKADLDRRYTSRETMDLCMRLAGVKAWDLDVAADAESHWAPAWYSAAGDVVSAGWAGENGLEQPWRGRVWCNPPFSDLEAWVVKAWREWEASQPLVIGMLLPANRCEQAWWQAHVELHRDDEGPLRTHFLPTRIRFGHPGNPRGHGVGSPPFGCVLAVWARGRHGTGVTAPRST